VQKVSGMRFGEFLRTRIFEPLRMNDTSFNCPPEKLDRLTSCYVAQPDGSLGLDDDAARSAFAPPTKMESGGGGLLSTMHDYMRFCRMLLNGGGRDAAEMAYYPTVGEESLRGCGYSVCCATTIDLGRRRMPASLGEFFWSG